MMNLEIDHIFQVVSCEEEAYELAKATGLKIAQKRVHTGQGTSAIFLVFEKSYFEFIWMSDEAEAKQNITRFDLKLEAIRNGGSPFGVALRGELSENMKSHFHEYRPEYGIGRFTILRHIESSEHYCMPKIFLMKNPERPNFSDWYPSSLNPDRPDANFDVSLKKFEKVKIYTNAIPALSIPCIKFIQSNENKMIINDGESGHFTDLVSY